MLNYNKIIRQNSHQKTRSKSIYNGNQNNKSHTTSMNLKISADLISQFNNITKEQNNYNHYYIDKQKQKQRISQGTIGSQSQSILKNITVNSNINYNIGMTNRAHGMNQDKKYLQQKYKIMKQFINPTNIKQQIQLRSDHKQSQKNKSNKKIKIIPQNQQKQSLKQSLKQNQRIQKQKDRETYNNKDRQAYNNKDRQAYHKDRQNHKQRQSHHKQRQLRQSIVGLSIKNSNRGSFMQKSRTSILSQHKNSIIGLQTQRFSRQKSWKKLEQRNIDKNQRNQKQYEKSQSRISNKNINQINNHHIIRLKTDYTLHTNQNNQINSNEEQMHLNNIYNQMTSSYQKSHNKNNQTYLHSHTPSKLKGINLFNVNVKKQQLFTPNLQPNTKQNQQQRQLQFVQVNIGQLKQLMRNINQFKDKRQELKKQIGFYKNVSKKQKIKNSVFKALR